MTALIKECLLHVTHAVSTVVNVVCIVQACTMDIKGVYWICTLVQLYVFPRVQIQYTLDIHGTTITCTSLVHVSNNM